MSKSGQLFIAQTQGTRFTLYAVMRALGIPLSKEQAEFQAYLEAHYPPEQPEQEVKDADSKRGN